jgi:hypothetical protein
MIFMFDGSPISAAAPLGKTFPIVSIIGGAPVQPTSSS